jgi:hypothetical protein
LSLHGVLLLGSNTEGSTTMSERAELVRETLHRTEGWLTPPEIAAITGLTSAQVRAQIYRLRSEGGQGKRFVSKATGQRLSPGYHRRWNCGLEERESPPGARPVAYRWIAE